MRLSCLDLAAELINVEQPMCSASVGADIQAASRSTPGHYLTDVFHNQMEDSTHKHSSIMLQLGWMPGHVGIAGNE